jgi:hypothetical protein
MMGSNDSSFPVPQARVDGQQILPSSAPVSSLLPPIPSNHAQLLQQHLQASIQAQIAALLNHGAQPTPVVPPTMSLGVPVPPANPAHLLAATAAVVAAPAVGVVPQNPLMSTVDMHGWSVEQIGKFAIFVLCLFYLFFVNSKPFMYCYYFLNVHSHALLEIRRKSH